MLRSMNMHLDFPAQLARKLFIDGIAPGRPVRRALLVAVQVAPANTLDVVPALPIRAAITG